MKWKLLFFIILFGQINIFSNLLLNFTLSNLFISVFTLINLIALFSFAFDIKLITPKFWYYYFYFLILFFLINFLFNIKNIFNLFNNLTNFKIINFFILLFSFILGPLLDMFVVYSLSKNKTNKNY